MYALFRKNNKFMLIDFILHCVAWLLHEDLAAEHFSALTAIQYISHLSHNLPPPHFHEWFPILSTNHMLESKHPID